MSNSDLSFEETWDKMDKEFISEKELEELESHPDGVRRINQQSMIEAMQRHHRPFAAGLPKKPHHKYPSNYTPPKRRLRKKK